MKRARLQKRTAPSADFSPGLSKKVWLEKGKGRFRSLGISFLVSAFGLFLVIERCIRVLGRVRFSVTKIGKFLVGMEHRPPDSDSMLRYPCREGPPPLFPTRTSRTLDASSSGLNGFSMNADPGTIISRSMAVSSVWADM
jgi:hypothetical protein